MNCEVTYEDFTAIYGETLGEDAFMACLPFATDIVKELCWPREPNNDEQAQVWKRAVCASIYADWINGAGHGLDDGAGTSLSIGSVSLSGGSAGEGSSGSATLDSMRVSAKRALIGSGLLFHGLGEL